MSAFCLLEISETLSYAKGNAGLLFGADNLPFDALVVVRSSACRTEAVHVVLDVIVAELTYLVQVPC